jgi:hypothetical protein
MSIGFSPKECAKALMSAENILPFPNSFVVRKIIDFFSRIQNWIALQFLKIQRESFELEWYSSCPYRATKNWTP